MEKLSNFSFEDGGAGRSYTGIRTVARSPRLAVAQGYVAAVRAGDIERDRKAEPGAAFVLVARVVERGPGASTMAPVVRAF